MALGKPVIRTLGASFDEMIADGETGFWAGDVGVPWPQSKEALGMLQVRWDWSGSKA